MHPEIKVSIIDRVHNPSELDTPSLKVLRHKEVPGLLHVLGVVEYTKVNVVRTPRVVLRVVRCNDPR